MKVTTFIQVVPSFDRNGRVTRLRVTRASSTNPREPMAGSLVIKMNLEVPEKVFSPVVINVNIPIEAVGPVSVSVPSAKGIAE